MARISKALEKLRAKCTSEGQPAGNSTAEILDCIAEHFDVTGEKGDPGEKGDTGAYVTAIELELTEGVVSGGTATLSDGSEVEITVTTASAGE